MSGDQMKDIQDPLFARVNRTKRENKPKSAPPVGSDDGGSGAGPSGSGREIWKYVVTGVLFLTILGIGYYLYTTQQEQIQVLHQNLTQSQQHLASVTEELQTSQEKLGDLAEGLSSSETRIKRQSGELNRYKGLVKDLKDETGTLKQEQQQQIREVQALSVQKADRSQVDDLKGETNEIRQQVGEANSNISDLKNVTARNQSDIAGNRTDITRVDAKADATVVDLSDFKTSLDRDTYNFELEKKGAVMKVVNVSLNLKKTNFSKQRYEMEIVADGRRFKKSKVNVNEPIVFYVQGVEKPYQVVVTKVGKNFVVGYLSVPKDVKKAASVSG